MKRKNKLEIKYHPHFMEPIDEGYEAAMKQADWIIDEFVPSIKPDWKRE